MEEQCCPPFDPEKWQGRTVTWTNKKFAKDKVFCLFYVPLTFGRAMRRLMGKVEQVHADCSENLSLSDHTSKWNMDVYVGVDRDLPGTEMTAISGSFFARVYEGPFSDTAKWCADYAEQARRQGVEIGKQYMWYTTCPKCAKKYGKIYVVVMGQVKAASAAA